VVPAASADFEHHDPAASFDSLQIVRSIKSMYSAGSSSQTPSMTPPRRPAFSSASNRLNVSNILLRLNLNRMHRHVTDFSDWWSLRQSVSATLMAVNFV
jgi:hypothetical protein